MSLSSRWSFLTSEQLESLQLEWQRSWETLVLRDDWQGNLMPCLHQTQVAIGCVDPGSSLQAIKDRRRTQQCLPQRYHISFTLKNCNESHKEVLGHMQDNLTLGNCCNSNTKLSLLKVHPPVPLLRKTFKLVVTWLPGDDTLCRLLITRYGPSILGQGIQTRCQWPCMFHISNGLTSRNAAPRHRWHTCINPVWNYILRWNISQKTQKQKYCHWIKAWDPDILILKKQHSDLSLHFGPWIKCYHQDHL